MENKSKRPARFAVVKHLQSERQTILTAIHQHSDRLQPLKTNLYLLYTLSVKPEGDLEKYIQAHTELQKAIIEILFETYEGYDLLIKAFANYVLLEDVFHTDFSYRYYPPFCRKLFYELFKNVSLN